MPPARGSDRSFDYRLDVGFDGVTAQPRMGPIGLAQLPNNSAISVTSGGNVGIGTTSPTAPLDVRGASTYMLNPNGNFTLGLQGNGSHLWNFTAQSAANGNKFLFDQYMTIDGNSGNVGIGTMSPVGTLQVVADVNRQLYLTGTDNNKRLAVGYDLSNNTGVVEALLNGSARPLLLNPSGGNVGIGTTNPQSTLAVNGNITAKDVMVTNTGWPDYVFRPGYRLRPLNEVNAYIQAHHHLPDVPSEADVKEKGVSLGEMQSLLLAKVEELTLHMIQQEKENKELRERIVQLESQAASHGASTSAR